MERPEASGTAIYAAHVVGLTTTAFAAGAIAGLSFMTIPGIKLAPAQLAAKQWKQVFDIGKAAMPPLAVVSATIFATLAYREQSGSPSKPFYAAAALILPTIVPFTVAVMGPTNNELIARALSTKAAPASLEAATERSTVALLDKWARLNATRSVILLIGAACAAYAVFRTDSVKKTVR